MKKKLNFIAICFLMIVLLLTGCTSGKKTEDAPKDSNTVAEENNEDSKPTSTAGKEKTLSAAERAWLPYYRNGWAFAFEEVTNGRKPTKLFYLGDYVSKVDSQYEVYGKKYYSKDIAPVSKEKGWYFYDWNTYAGATPALYYHDVSTDIDRVVADESVFEKYGDYSKMLYNGSQLFILCSGVNRTNVLTLTDGSTEPVMQCQIMDETFNFRPENFILQGDGTYHFVKTDMYTTTDIICNVNFSTGAISEIETIERQTGEERLYNNQFAYLPNGKDYFEVNTRKEDPIKGNIENFKQIIEYDKQTQERTVIAEVSLDEINGDFLEGAYVNDKQLIILTANGGVTGTDQYIIVDLTEKDAEGLCPYRTKSIAIDDMDLWNAYVKGEKTVL
ncbi:hypothetical protein [Eubacterium maltosivorans]|uniref:hypothetical protein n=1 Tax=Eubacterium maltosivorans TaxID=2041044 RepID=UPI00189F5483|nr:hypothetical protein [Eubacterium maltosivorans]